MTTIKEAYDFLSTGDVYIRPAKVAKYITLNFVAVRTGVTFDEVIGSFNKEETIKGAYERLS